MGVRAGSAAAGIVEALVGLPVFTVEDMADRTGLAERAVQRGVERLLESQVVSEVTDRKRDRVYAVTDVLDEFEDLDMRIRERVTRLRSAK